MDGSDTPFSFGSLSRSNALLPPVSAFSAYSLLRNCNYFLGTSAQGLADEAPAYAYKLFRNKHNFSPKIYSHLKSLREVPTDNPRISAHDEFQLFPSLESEKTCLNLAPKAFFTPLIPYSHSLRILQSDQSPGSRLGAVSPSLSSSGFKKQRSEKKPIPDEQKDDKYFERRRRNNQAAKKSRDARKIREDQVALKATILEHENAILRAQVLTLREEASSLRQMLLQRKSFELPPG